MTMSTDIRKNIFLFIILGFILVLFITFLIMDWGIRPHRESVVSKLSEILKYNMSCLCIIIALIIGKDGLDKRDTLLLRIGYGFIFFADSFLVIGNRFFDPSGHKIFFIAGICSFMGLHCILILRHSREMISAFRKKERILIIYFILTALIICFLLILNIYVVVTGGREIIIIIMLIVYALILTISLWIGWGTFTYGFFPRLNAWFIAIGLTIHYISDICIVLSMTITDSAHITGPLVWTLYGPAIVLLALSGYKFPHSH